MGDRRQDARQARREHGLAGAGRADEQQIVPPGRSDLERATRMRLADDIDKIRRSRQGRWNRHGLTARQQLIALKMRAHLKQIACRIDLRIGNLRGFIGIGFRHDHTLAEARRLDHRRQQTGDAAQLTGQRKFAITLVVDDGFKRNLARGGEYAERNGQIEPGTLFGQLIFQTARIGQICAIRVSKPEGNLEESSELSVSFDEGPDDPASAGKRKRSSNLPVRRRRKGNYLTVTGKFCSSKFHFLIPFEGMRERDFFVILEFDSVVARFFAQPMTLIITVQGLKRKYTPDVLVEFVPNPDGTKEWPDVCEVKLSVEYERDEEYLREKYAVATSMLAAKGRRFRLVTEKELRQPLMANLNFLLVYRRYLPEPTLKQAIVELLAANGPISVDDAVSKLERDGLEPLRALSEIWRSVAMGEMSTEFDRPLTMFSKVWNAPWSIREVLAREPESLPSTPGIGSMERASDEARHHAAQLETMDVGPVVHCLEIGGIYGKENSPGAYRLIQLDSPEAGLVEEIGSGTISECPTSLLRSLASNARRRRNPNELTDAQRKEAEAILASIEPYLDRSKRISHAEAEKEALALEVKPRTWRKWVSQYRQSPSLSTLVRMPRKDRGVSRLDDFVEATAKKFVEHWLNNQSTPMAEVYRDMCDEIKDLNAKAQSNFEVPDYTTFYQRCRALPEIVKVAGMSGQRIAKLSHGLNRGSLRDVHAPLSYIQIDHTEINVGVVDEETRTFCGRPWITVAIDVFSRMIVGFYLSLRPPGNLQLGRAVVHTIMPKAPYLKAMAVDVPWPCSGYPVAVHADNAGEFQGNMMELAAVEHGFHLYFRKVKHPNYGGHIENYLGKLSRKIKTLPGWIAQSDEELGEREPDEEACVTMKELEAWLIKVFAEYHSESHSSLSEQSPLNRWRDGCRGTMSNPGLGAVRLPANTTKLHIDFLPVEERVVEPTGIRLDYIDYQSPHLQKWVGARDPNNVKNARKFKIRRDPRDISVIYFWDPEDLRYYAIPYRTPTRPRMTLWELQEIRKAIAARNISDIDEELIFRVRSERRRDIELARQTTSATRKRAKAAENQRIALAEARKLQDEIAIDVTAPSTAPAAPEATLEESELPDENDVTSFEDVM